MRGLLYTGPRTILHNLRKTVERAGVQVENVIISPLAMVQSVLNEGEREFGATVIDMGQVKRLSLQSVIKNSSSHIFSKKVEIM